MSKIQGLKIQITETTYRNVEQSYNDLITSPHIMLQSISVTSNYSDDVYTLTIEELDNYLVILVYNLLEEICDTCPNEKKYGFIKNKKYCIEDELFIRLILENSNPNDDHPWYKSHALSNILKIKEITTLEELRNLNKIPYSGILEFNYFDALKIHTLPDYYELLNTKFGSDNSIAANYIIEADHEDIFITNRYIKNDLKISHGTVELNNCIIDANVTISSSSFVSLSHCIIIGKLTCTDIEKIDLNCANIKHLLLFNSQMAFFNINYCKIYRIEFHSSLVQQKLNWYQNQFIEPYFAALILPESNLNLSQFDTRKINRKIIRNQNIRIRDEDTFYTKFELSKKQPANKKIKNAEAEITLDTVNFLLKEGQYKINRDFFADLMYKKALYSNVGLRKAFVFISGALYKPTRMLLYLIISTFLFTAIYTLFPQMRFINVTTLKVVNIDIWEAFYYSLFQIIGANPTIYSATGVTQILTALQAALNTALIASLFASITNKYIKEVHKSAN